MSEETENKKDERPLWRRVLGRLVKISLILAVVLFILLTVLSRMGGNTDVLKKGIEDYITDATPYTARIGKLNNMQFFPSIVMSASEIELRQGDDGTGEAAIRIANADLGFGFFDVMFRPGRIQTLKIENLSASAGSILAKPLTLETLSIGGATEDDAHLNIKGAIGKKPLSGKIGLGTVDGKTYVLGNESGFDVTIGKLNAKGVLKNPLVGDFKLENLILTQNDKTALRGNFDIGTGKGQFTVKGQGRLEPNKSQIDPDIKIEWGKNPTEITGDVESGLLVYEDVSDNAVFLKLIDEIGEVFGNETPSDYIIPKGIKADINLDIKALRIRGVNMGVVDTPLKISEGAMTIGPLDGAIRKGKLSGDIKFTPEGGSTKFENNITIKGLDYGAYQREFAENAKIDGVADIKVALSSKGKKMDALVDGLSGKVSFVSGNAQMETGVLELWGGGLLNALLPNLGKKDDVNVNCVVVNMDVKNLKGQSDAVFVDTKRITVRGKGTYDFKKNFLDMIVEPNAKDIAIGDLSSAVNVSGPLDDLSVTPNAFSLGKKVGGLLLGAVNPAFYALSLANLGLGDNHPCKQFVIEKEVLPPPENKEERVNPDPSTTQAEETVPGEGAKESLEKTSVGNE